MKQQKCNHCGKIFPLTSEFFYMVHKKYFRTICKKCTIFKVSDKTRARVVAENLRLSVLAHKRNGRKCDIEKINKKCEDAESYYKDLLSGKIKNKKPLTICEWNKTLEKFKYSCAYCGCKNKKLQRDHIVPVSKKGIFTKNNIIPVCLSCNMSKGAHDWKKWFLKYKFYNKEREKIIINHICIS